MGPQAEPSRAGPGVAGQSAPGRHVPLRHWPEAQCWGGACRPAFSLGDQGASRLGEGDPLGDGEQLSWLAGEVGFSVLKPGKPPANQDEPGEASLRWGVPGRVGRP